MIRKIRMIGAVGSVGVVDSDVVSGKHHEH